MKLCSACLLGIPCRYDGKSKLNEKVVAMVKNGGVLPVCPEQLGGLETPRAGAEIKEGRVITGSGKEVTESYKKGAEIVLDICRQFGITEAILKQKSPSCGSGKIYDGSFEGKLIEGDGITTKVLKEHGIKVISEEDL